MRDETHYARITREPRGSFFLFGVRGVGKSTWAKARFPSAHRIDLLDEARYHDLLADPSLFAAEVEALPRDIPVIVDEVQRIPGLLNDVHRLIEEDGRRFILLGSSARKLKTAGTNLLAGRAVWKTMHPLVPEELGRDFSLNRVLAHGSIAVMSRAEDPPKALQAYVQLYLKEEIRGEALVRNLPGFARFLPIAALFHGQVANVSSIARDAGTARTTVNGYLEILEDTLFAFRLPAFEARLRTRERKLPKLYWVDPGLVRAVKKQTGPIAIEEQGPLLEGWVLGLLRAYAEERDLFDEIFYWAPSAGTRVEVDFLLRRAGALLAIEVKSQRKFSSGLLSGLKAIADAPEVVRRILVYRGSRPLRVDGVDVWPVERLLHALQSDGLWP
jgi:predicted AAA+ superfamily ATPase